MNLSKKNTTNRLSVHHGSIYYCRFVREQYATESFFYTREQYTTDKFFTSENNIFLIDFLYIKEQYTTDSFYLVKQGTIDFLYIREQYDTYRFFVHQGKICYRWIFFNSGNILLPVDFFVHQGTIHY